MGHILHEKLLFGKETEGKVHFREGEEMMFWYHICLTFEENGQSAVEAMVVQIILWGGVKPQLFQFNVEAKRRSRTPTHSRTSGR